MSDGYVNPSAGIDASLDAAFDAVSQAHEDHAEAAGAAIQSPDGAQLPTELSTRGLWKQAEEIAQAKKDSKAAKAAKAKADKAAREDEDEDDFEDEGLSKAEIHGRKVKDQNEGLDASLDKAMNKSAEAQKARAEERTGELAGTKPKPMSTKAFNEPDIVEARKELRARFPDKKLSERMGMFERWESAFKKDPVAARQAIMAEYLKVSPQNFAKPKAGEEREGLGGAVDRATANAGDLADLKPYADKYGEHLPHLLRQLNAIEKDLIDDPVGASARLAANYGALDAPAQQQAPAAQQAQQSPAAAHPHLESVNRGLEKIIEHKMMPGLEDPYIQEALAIVLETGLVPRTGDRLADLQAAYALVVEQDGKGQKSIHGAPSNSNAWHGRRSGKGSSLDAALDRAFGGM